MHVFGLGENPEGVYIEKSSVKPGIFSLWGKNSTIQEQHKYFAMSLEITRNIQRPFSSQNAKNINISFVYKDKKAGDVMSMFY